MKITTRNIFLWALRLTAVTILLQTLIFKFGGAEESIYIFSQLGMEPWGRIASGFLELIASILILIPSKTAWGALLAFCTMTGALLAHFTKLGIAVMNDGGQLFALAIVVWLCSGILMWLCRKQLSTKK